MAAAAADRNAAGHTRQVFLYFGPLTLLIYLALPQGLLLDFATSYMLKDQLHASATQLSAFRLLTAIPLYLAFVFGLARDLWNPLGLRDRGFFLVFAPMTALVFLWMALSQLSYAGLFTGMLLVMISFRLVAAAYGGLIALVGQEKLVSGRLSALWSGVSYALYAGGSFASGYIAAHWSPRQVFLLMAVLVALIACQGLWKPRAIFNHAYDQPQARGSNLVGDLKRLVRHRAVYPAVLINFLWYFSPGSSTPMLYYLTNQLHASNTTFSYYYGILVLSFIPTVLLYGFLCRKIALNKLLWWGTIVAVPQFVPLALIHSANVALVLAVPMGLMGGLATAAYIDLAMRSCPPGLQGTLMMLVDGGIALSYRGGDVLGSWIYGSSPAHGFLYCVLAITSVYACILPVLLLIPKELIATADGEPNPAVAAGVLAEIRTT
jgi:hypothetical protein